MENNTSFSVNDLLKILTEHDNMSVEDAQNVYREMEKEILIKKYNLPQAKSSDGYYHVNVKDPTKKTGRRQLKAKTIDELKNKLYDWERGIFGEAKKSFEDVFNLAQSEKLKYIKDKEKLLSAKNTMWRTEKFYQQFFADTSFAEKPIEDISKKDIEDICLYNLRRYDLKKKAFLSLRGILKMTFSLAYEYYWIVDNVYDRVQFNKFNDMIIRPTPIDKRVHTDAEMERIIAFIHHKHYENFEYLPAYALELQIAMGLRRGEVPPLMWDDIKEDCILISKEQITVKDPSLGKNNTDIIVQHTKTWKDRKFPLTEEIKEILRGIRLVHERLNFDSPYLFPADNKSGVISNNVVYKFYYRMCKKLSIPICTEFKKGTHSFRRNAITKVANNSDGGIFLASQLFGNSPQIAQDNYYTGLDLKKAKDVIEGI